MFLFLPDRWLTTFPDIKTCSSPTSAWTSRISALYVESPATINIQPHITYPFSDTSKPRTPSYVSYTRLEYSLSLQIGFDFSQIMAPPSAGEPRTTESSHKTHPISSRTALSRETAGDPSRKTPSELRQEQLAPTYLWMTTLEQLNLLPAPLEHLHYLFPCQGPSTNQGASPARLG